MKKLFVFIKQHAIAVCIVSFLLTFTALSLVDTFVYGHGIKNNPNLNPLVVGGGSGGETGDTGGDTGTGPNTVICYNTYGNCSIFNCHTITFCNSCKAVKADKDSWKDRGSCIPTSD